MARMALSTLQGSRNKDCSMVLGDLEGKAEAEGNQKGHSPRLVCKGCRVGRG